MSQAIQGFTPQQPAYQGNLQQQQVSAALASSSSSMPGDSISPVAIGLGVTAGGLLTVAAATLAVKHFSTSSDKPKPAQATSLTSNPVKREDAAQIGSTQESTEENASRQPALPPLQKTRQSQSVSSSTPTQREPMIGPGEEMSLPSSPQREPRIDTIPGFPGFIHPSDGVYRDEPISGEVGCGKAAMDTILYFFFKEKKLLTEEEFQKQAPRALEEGASGVELVDIAESAGLDVDIVLKRTNGENINAIHNAEAFIILERGEPYHCIAFVRPEGKDKFYLSDSYNQNKDEIYPKTKQEKPYTATDAFRDYTETKNITAHWVITFRKRDPNQSKKFIGKDLWGYERSPQGDRVRIPRPIP